GRGDALDEEVGVDGDARAAHADPRLVDSRGRLRVRHPDRVEHVDVARLRAQRQLVGERDVDVAVERGRQLGEFRYLRGRDLDDRGVEHLAVEGPGHPRAVRVDAADDLRIGREITEDLPRFDAFRAEGEREVPAGVQPGPPLQPWPETGAGVAD